VPGPDRNRNREPLEEFPVDSLRMVGTIDFNGHTYALVKAPDSVIHRVTIGDHMGQNYGKIVTITPSEVDLSEVIPDGFGGWTERPASLALEE
jgi:type IV pilus assembly protein PilP